MRYRETYYQVNNIELHAMEAGEVGAPVILFLHGFPEFWYGWHKQLDYFAQQGFHVVAPDQRGYNLSSKPAGARAYTVDTLVADTAALIRSITDRQVILVGHDWGGIVAWATATRHPELLQKLICLNIAHPVVLAEHLRSDPRQMLRSWYIGLFQLPLLPEFLLKSFNYAYLEKSMKKSAKRGTFSSTDFEHYKKAWKQPGALTTMINWYRALKHSRFHYSPVRVPTFLLWGKKDAFLRYQMAQHSLDKCQQAQLIYLDNATHWLHHEQPDRVNELLHRFIQEQV